MLVGCRHAGLSALLVLARKWRAAASKATGDCCGRKPDPASSARRPRSSGWDVVAVEIGRESSFPGTPS
jgi:hypothetical protein